MALLRGFGTVCSHVGYPLSMNTARNLSALAIVGIAGAAGAQTLDLKPVYSGGMKIAGFYMPKLLPLTQTKPGSVTKIPADVTSPWYGVIKMGGKEFVVLADEPAGKPARLFVDTNADGDLTNDPETVWKAQPEGRAKYMGSMQVLIPFGDGKTPVTLGAYQFDWNNAPQPALKNSILYYSDYALSGEATLGGKTYHAAVIDPAARGSFDKVETAGQNQLPGPMFLIDVNGNGKFDRIGEQYDAAKPFNIGGTTYEIDGFGPSGGQLKLAKSTQTVAEILPPQDLSAGHNAIPFDVTTTAGKPISFPGSFKGKVVMLDFWATWCGPCMGEMPNVVAAYNKYHARGFDILGISLDNKDTFKNLTKVTSEQNMPWQQVCDQKFWDAEIAKKYYIDSIPHAFLIDGDTGTILAEGESIRGDQLAPAIEKALASKHR